MIDKLKIIIASRHTLVHFQVVFILPGVGVLCRVNSLFGLLCSDIFTYKHVLVTAGRNNDHFSESGISCTYGVLSIVACLTVSTYCLVVFCEMKNLGICISNYFGNSSSIVRSRRQTYSTTCVPVQGGSISYR
uniref:7TM_GPCR_Srx domain-containing protein n=1 Tax=Heterorhabditis bacteriophora TaxID=37862 RepID=A0A1I7WCY2_HETBA